MTGKVFMPSLGKLGMGSTIGKAPMSPMSPMSKGFTGSMMGKGSTSVMGKSGMGSMMGKGHKASMGKPGMGSMMGKGHKATMNRPPPGDRRVTFARLPNEGRLRYALRPLFKNPWAPKEKPRWQKPALDPKGLKDSKTANQEMRQKGFSPYRQGSRPPPRKSQFTYSTRPKEWRLRHAIKTGFRQLAMPKAKWQKPGLNMKGLKDSKTANQEMRQKGFSPYPEGSRPPPRNGGATGSTRPKEGRPKSSRTGSTQSLPSKWKGRTQRPAPGQMRLKYLKDLKAYKYNQALRQKGLPYKDVPKPPPRKWQFTYSTRPKEWRLRHAIKTGFKPPAMPKSKWQPRPGPGIKAMKDSKSASQEELQKGSSPNVKAWLAGTPDRYRHGPFDKKGQWSRWYEPRRPDEPDKGYTYPVTKPSANPPALGPSGSPPSSLSGETIGTPPKVPSLSSSFKWDWSKLPKPPKGKYDTTDPIGTPPKVPSLPSSFRWDMKLPYGRYPKTETVGTPAKVPSLPSSFSWDVKSKMSDQVWAKAPSLPSSFNWDLRTQPTMSDQVWVKAPHLPSSFNWDLRTQHSMSNKVWSEAQSLPSSFTWGPRPDLGRALPKHPLTDPIKIWDPTKPSKRYSEKGPKFYMNKEYIGDKTNYLSKITAKDNLDFKGFKPFPDKWIK
ncbi:hypothetical protein LIA77_11896 [Sarocladium implicatum]|nr:hypothetical protein LIA77_11896 [Sarocladium implicatum]